MSKKIFISYRRKDSADFTVALYNELCLLFGEETVFKDINDIPPGMDFNSVLDIALKESGVVLVIMGPTYFSKHGHRLFNDFDWVRQEVIRSLEAGLRVVPVLINGAPFPKKGDMPDEMWPLMSRQAVTMRNATFKEDVARLAEGISDDIPLIKEERPAQTPNQILDVVFRGILLLLMLACIGLLIFAWTISDTNLQEKLFMSLISVTGLIGGGVGFTRQRWLELRSHSLT